MRDHRPQVNVPLDGSLFDVVGVLATRDHTSSGALLKPVVERFLRRQLKDANVAAAVEAIRRSRDAGKQHDAKQHRRATVTALPAKGIRKRRVQGR